MSATELRRKARLYDNIARSARGLSKERFGDMADRFESAAARLRDEARVA